MDYNDIRAKLEAFNLAETVPAILQKAASIGNWELQEEFENLKMTYQQMIQFMLNGMNDPQSERIRMDICRKLNFLVSRLERQERLAKHPEEKYVSVRKGLRNIPSFENIVSQLESLSTEIEQIHQEELLKENVRQHRLEQLMPMHETAVLNLFNWTWTSEVWQHADVDQANQLIFSDHIGSHEKAVFISAVTLSLFEFIDIAKLLFLLDCYLVNDLQVSQRALVGFLLVFYLRFEQVNHSQDLKDRLIIYRDDASFVHDVYSTMMQLQMSCTTDSVSSKMRNDIIPALMNSLMPKKGKEKDKNLGDLMKNGENPEWFINEKADKKMQEMADLQLDGADIYYASFASFKGHSFFSQMPHWFYPFSLDSIHTPAMTNILNSEIGKFVKVLLSGSPFCNSDKYSLCFTFQQLDSVGRSAIEAQVGRQLPDSVDLEELAEQVEIKQPKKADLRRQYIFDLYRFYYTYPYRQQFTNPFAVLKEQPFTPLGNPWLKKLLGNDKEAHANYADFLMRKEFYVTALQLFEKLVDNEFDASLASLWQKIGFCHQKLNHTAEAIHAYRVANQLKPNSKWTLSHLAALCYTSGNMEDAAQHYQNLLEISPENSKYLFNASHSLILCHRHDEALPLLYKASYLDEQSMPVKQLLVWCLILCDKKEEAMKQLQNMLSADATDENTLMLHAILLLISGQPKDAYQQLQPLINENNLNDLGRKLRMLHQEHLIEKNLLTLFMDALMLAFPID